MPKELFLIRHAETENPELGLKDIDRQLTADGEIESSKIGKFLSKLVNDPDLVLSSTSQRTRQTVGLIAEQLQCNPSNIDYQEDLYESSTRILLRVINSMLEKNEKVIVVGHNPSITFLAEYITGAEIGSVSPAGIVHIKNEGSWAEITQNSSDLVQYYDPSML
ncbi:MAG: histidine phosphatase family protein [Reichenbachiella sp.]